MFRDAIISACGTYRYTLVRQWDQTKPLLPFLMLNPSTADAKQDDPTIRRCIGFADREGCGGIVVVNLYAFRSTDPKRLVDVVDPVGPFNMTAIHDVAAVASEAGVPIVCAWGANDFARSGGVTMYYAILAGAKLVCLGKTKSGHPRHPLYVKGTQPMESYP